MKLSSITILTAATLLLGGCSLDNPFSGLFHSAGHDERVYNPQTGQWEWPPDKRAPKSAATPGPRSYGDTRYWDAQHNQWVESPAERSGSSKAKPTPPPAAPVTAAQVPPTPPPPRASHATGVYNSSTGKIEWGNSGGYVPSAPTPEPKKHWYWPF